MDVTTNNTKSKVNIRLLVGTGMLSGLAFVLQYLEFPIPIMPFLLGLIFRPACTYRSICIRTVSRSDCRVYQEPASLYSNTELYGRRAFKLYSRSSIYRNGRAYIQEEQD